LRRIGHIAEHGRRDMLTFGSVRHAAARSASASRHWSEWTALHSPVTVSSVQQIAVIAPQLSSSTGPSISAQVVHRCHNIGWLPASQWSI